MNKIKYLFFMLLCLFSFSVVNAANEVVIKSIVPEYDTDSTMIVNNNGIEQGVIFSDSEQSIKYNVVIENTTTSDLVIKDILLANPSTNNLKYEMVGINENDVLKAKDTKDVTITLNTVNGEDWGRSFDDDLITSITFEGDINNPETGDKVDVVLILLIGSGLTLIILRSKKVRSYFLIVLICGLLIPNVEAKGQTTLNIKIDANYNNVNVMKAAYELNGNNLVFGDFWNERMKIKNIYVENEIKEITEYVYKYDVSEKQDESVIAYLVVNGTNNRFYDLYLQTNGPIAMNPNASYYFYDMNELDTINNMDGFDTLNVTDMNHIFAGTGYFNLDFKLDLGDNFDTRNVVDMSYMFFDCGSNSEVFTLELGDKFDTSNVTTMKNMFTFTGASSKVMTLDLGDKFDTSKVTDMTSMFEQTGDGSNSFILDITIKNPNVANYEKIFYRVATKDGAKVTVHYTSATSSLVDQMIDTKSEGSNVVKGNLVG